MADMPTQFWGGYIVIITVVTFIALAWLVFNVYFSSGRDQEVADQIWDENLREGATPAPLWWFWLILALMAVSVVYLMLYPGLGTFAGALKWSQGGELEQSLAGFAEEFGPERARIVAAGLPEVRDDPAAMSSGEHIYRVHCAACHGGDAKGQAKLFPDLTDSHWQWGGTEAQIRQTITAGRRAVMPPWQAALQDSGVAALAEYVIALAAGRGNAPELAPAKIRYDQFCSACHGVGGAGNAILGAPAFESGAWTYGGEYDDVYASIAAGRMGEMPAFADRLDEAQIKLLIAWLTSESE